MSYTTRFVFHLYDNHDLAVELVQPPSEASVFTEIMFFCLMVSRTLLKAKQKREAIETVAKWVDSFRKIANSISAGTTDVTRMKEEHSGNAWGVKFGGVPGTTQIMATLTIQQPNIVDYTFDIQENNWWFNVFGKHWIYGGSMACLWSFFVQRRITDLVYIRSLNMAGFLIGKAFFDGKLSPRTEPNVLRDVIVATVLAQQAQPSKMTGEDQHSWNVQRVLDEAKHGISKAQYLLAWLYETGDSALQDHEEALSWLRKAAANGNDQAQVQLGEIHHGRREYEDAVKWYRKAAEQDYPDGLRLLGDMYREGLGVAQDLVRSAELHRKGAEKGDPWCQHNLANAYVQGAGVEKDEALAFKWFTSAAEQGLAHAQGALGNMYHQGHAVKQDYGNALKWFMKAAEQGYAPAQNSLGLMYEAGEGIAQDFSVAAGWYRKAAEQGNPYAQANLGRLYAERKGDPNDVSEAVRWYTEAAKQGLAEAKVRLAVLYEVLGNVSEARKWYLSAAEQGHEKAKQRLTELL